MNFDRVLNALFPDRSRFYKLLENRGEKSGLRGIYTIKNSSFYDYLCKLEHCLSRNIKAQYICPQGILGAPAHQTNPPTLNLQPLG